MDFVAVMDQGIALLRQRGRLTYRTLRLQFQLDETHLEVLKDELIYGQRLAVDEGRRVLVWTGDAATPSALLPPSSQPASQPARRRRHCLTRHRPLLHPPRPRRNVASSPCCSAI